MLAGQSAKALNQLNREGHLTLATLSALKLQHRPGLLDARIALHITRPNATGLGSPLTFVEDAAFACIYP